MSIKDLALSFGIALVFPLTVYYGIMLFSPTYDYMERSSFNEQIWKKSQGASEDEKAKLSAEKEKFEKSWNEKILRIEKIHFYASVPLGILTVVVGTFLQPAYLGGGLMFGGILTTFWGVSAYWRHLSDVFKLIGLLIMLTLLSLLGFRANAKNN